MIKEAYCSEEITKLLIKKGFNADQAYIFPITHQLAVKWLREEKYVIIFIVPTKDKIGNFAYYANVWGWNEYKGLYDSIWTTSNYNYVYEEAVEDALKYCLTNLI